MQNNVGVSSPKYYELDRWLKTTVSDLIQNTKFGNENKTQLSQIDTFIHKMSIKKVSDVV